MKSLNTRFKGLFAVALLAITALMVAIPVPTHAATTNYSTSVPGVVVMPFHISGQYTATTAGVIRFAIPFKARLVGVGASARASGGTTPTLTVDVLVGGTTLLSAPITVTAGAYAEGTISTAAIADEGAVTVDLTIGGTSPTWNDITVVLTLLRT
jgi:hypothetical protein